jgi:L-asparaginase
VSTATYDTQPARRVRVLAAGGTIGMATKASDGGKPALGAEELLASVDGLGQVEGETVINVPSAHLRLEDVLTICKAARDVARRGVGVVVTHGTDSLE